MPIQSFDSLGTNTGRYAGDVRMGKPKILFLTRGKTFTSAELASSEAFQAALEASFLEGKSSINKMFPISGFHEVEDATGDPNFGALADGYEELLSEAIAKYTARHTGGAAQTQSYVAFNGWTDGQYIMDDKGFFWYVNTPTGGKYFTAGTFYAQYPRFGNTGAVNTLQVRFAFGDPDQFKAGSLGALRLNFNPLDLQNIVDVDLYESAAPAAYVFTVSARRLFSGTNIYESYKTLLTQIGAWEFFDLTTGAIISATAVTASDSVDSGRGGWLVTANNSPAITNGTKLGLRLKSPAILKALTTPVLGIESDYAAVTKAA